jgi:hypothetical protein
MVKPNTSFTSTQGVKYRGKGRYETPDNIINDGQLNNIKDEDSPYFTDFEETVKDYILLSLGHPLVTVELNDAQLLLCVHKALSRMEYYAPAYNTNYMTFVTSGGVNGYELPSFVTDNIEYVVYKKTLLSIASQEGTLERDILIKYYQENFVFRNFDIGEYYLFMSHMEDVRKVLGREGSWQIINGNQVWLYPEPTEQEEVIVEYRSLDANTIHHFVRNWINEYAVAHAKEILGTIRGKYPAGLPGPDGATQLDGQILRQESKQEKELLEQKLRDEFNGQDFITLF